MPIYEFSCKKCGYKGEKIASMKTTSIPCPDCNKEAKKIMSASNFTIKGFSEANGYSRKNNVN